MKKLLTTFIENTLHYFGFLEKEYKMMYEQTDICTIRWIKENYCLYISYDYSRSYEINIFFHKINDNTSPFDIYDLMKYSDIEFGDISVFQASSEERVTQIIEKISGNLYHVMQKSDMFTSEVINKLREQRERECTTKAMQDKLFWMRKDLEIAWREKNYVEVKKLLEPFLYDISQTETKKYRYAVKKCDN